MRKIGKILKKFKIFFLSLTIFPTTQGPKGGPGMPEMLAPSAALIGCGLGDKVALITDGRFSGATR